MGKYVVLTRLTVFDEDFIMYDGIENLLISLNKENHKIVIISQDINSLRVMKKVFEDLFDFEVECSYRRTIREKVNEENAKDFILVGSSDDDLILAANKRILIINPGWSVKQDEKPARYGITLKRPKQLFEAIMLINNQDRWYFELEVNESSTVLALTSANTMNRDVKKTEKEVLEGFENLLKSGNRRYFNTLYFHLISGVMKNPALRTVDIWGTFPSSSGALNDELEELKERCRYLTGKRMSQPLFIRHTAVSKSHHTPYATRISEGCKKHFDSITLNPYYASRVRGKVVCVLDDYLTNGISFETARNLLIKAGASKVFLVALGRYKRGHSGVYQSEKYNINGDIKSPGYSFELLTRENLVGTYNADSRAEVSRIYDILNG